MVNRWEGAEASFRLNGAEVLLINVLHVTHGISHVIIFDLNVLISKIAMYIVLQS